VRQVLFYFILFFYKSLAAYIKCLLND